MPKTQFIADFAVGDTVASLFLIASAQQGQAKNGPFWKLSLQDSSGSLEAKIWSPQCQMYPTLAAGDMVELAGRISMYREKLEIAVDRMRVLDPDEKSGLDLALFMPASDRPPAELLAELNALCKTHLTHGPWRKLLKSVLAAPEVTEHILTAPAAKVMHHAYAGGLVEHTLGVAKTCMAFADLYPDLDRQALLAGAVCHDLGKLWELSQGLATDYTGQGRLVGHIQLVMDFLDPLIRKSGLEDHLALHLKHLILSHHGQYEYGSPRLPSTAEAFALHYADNLDAKLNQVRGALANVPEDESGWSQYLPGLDRTVFKPLPTPPGPDAGQGSGQGSGQDAGRNADRTGGAKQPKRRPRQAAPRDEGLDAPGQLSLLGE